MLWRAERHLSSQCPRLIWKVLDTTLFPQDSPFLGPLLGRGCCCILRGWQVRLDPEWAPGTCLGRQNTCVGPAAVPAPEDRYSHPSAWGTDEKGCGSSGEGWTLGS